MGEYDKYATVGERTGHSPEASTACTTTCAAMKADHELVQVYLLTDDAAVMAGGSGNESVDEYEKQYFGEDVDPDESNEAESGTEHETHDEQSEHIVSQNNVLGRIKALAEAVDDHSGTQASPIVTKHDIWLCMQAVKVHHDHSDMVEQKLSELMQAASEDGVHHEAKDEKASDVMAASKKEEVRIVGKSIKRQRRNKAR